MFLLLFNKDSFKRSSNLPSFISISSSDFSDVSDSDSDLFFFSTLLFAVSNIITNTLTY